MASSTPPEPDDWGNYIQLLRALRHPHKRVRHRAIEALRPMGGPPPLAIR